MRPMLVALLLCSYSRGEISSVEELAPIQRAHEEVGQIKANYRKALQTAVETGGAEKAIGSCRLDASKLKGAKTGTMIVGRTSHKLRNPSNTAPDWVKPILEKWLKAKPKDIPKQELVELGLNHYGYAEPIFTEALCLNCHGAHLTPLMKKVIRASYPEDQATGFEVGELRGLLWLEKKP